MAGLSGQQGTLDRLPSKRKPTSSRNGPVHRYLEIKIDPKSLNYMIYGY